MDRSHGCYYCGGGISFFIGLYGVMKSYTDGYQLYSSRWWVSSNKSKKGKDYQLVRSTCEQDSNSDNDDEEKDTNLSKVVRYQIRDEGWSVVYTY